MAGDWIKMTHALPEKPEVLAISSKTGLNRFEVVGRLFIVWRWFDNNTIDGNAVGVTKVTLNECLFGYGDVTEFVSAMVDVHWLIESDDALAVVKFDEHNSESAKKRAQTAKRVAKHKKSPTGNALPNGEVTQAALPNALPREEKRREEGIQEEPNGSSRLAAPSDIPACPQDEIIGLYHEHLPELAQVKLKTESRSKAMRGFWRWVLTSKKSDGQKRANDADQALSWIRDYFGRVRGNAFLMGQQSSGRHANWRADFDFLLTERGRKHVIEKTEVSA